MKTLTCVALACCVGLVAGARRQHRQVARCPDEKPWCTIDEAIAPFDVPPKEWDGPETQYIPECGTASGVCFGEHPHPRHHTVCEDKARFLLRSEDGKTHCLKLVPESIGYLGGTPGDYLGVKP